MEDLLPGALLILLVGGVVFAWIDWRLRTRKLPRLLGPSWECPHCAVTNEAELMVCWSCGAAIARLGARPSVGPTAETWQCRKCRAWNSVSRQSCWSCATTPAKAPKRDV